MLGLALLAVGAACAAAAPRTSPSPGTATNAEFVQKLKEDLRRNNDDYILGRNLTEPETAPDSSERSSAYIDDIEEVYRRALVERGTPHLTIRSRLKAGRPPPPPPANTIKETNAKAGGVGAAKGGDAGKHHFRAMELSREHGHVLSPDQLDMAPARGRRITIIRNKGRLCQRHVLIPEGPKYDSQGRVYLRAHPPHAVRPYSHTRAPLLLLPRCCNCCKKSVLGCE